MKQILITGGAGFIGSHLCARLLGECDSSAEKSTFRVDQA